MKPYLSVVIPAYNEAARIGPTLRATVDWLSEQALLAEVLVVDDGSTDDTGGVVRALADELRRPEVRVELIESHPNRGKGHVVRAGMLTARGRLRLFMDADNSTPIHELPKLLDQIALGADVAIGSRRAAGATIANRPPWYRRAWSRLANRVVQAGLLTGIQDTQCGFKLFTAIAAERVFRRATTPGWAFDLEVLALARRLGHRIDEVAVHWSDDRRTRIRPLRDAIRITREFLRIRRAFRRGAYDLRRDPAGSWKLEAGSCLSPGR
jgi:glycosyltransferase involved in cell wall biosynthesis